MEDDCYPWDAKRRVEALIEVLEPAVKRDPDQELQGVAIIAADAAIKAVRDALNDDPVAQAIPDVISPEAVGDGDPQRAIDWLVAAKQLDAALGPRPISIA